MAQGPATSNNVCSAMAKTLFLAPAGRFRRQTLFAPHGLYFRRGGHARLARRGLVGNGSTLPHQQVARTGMSQSGLHGAGSRRWLSSDEIS
jgi:hypothetical protein